MNETHACFQVVRIPELLLYLLSICLFTILLGGCANEHRDFASAHKYLALSNDQLEPSTKFADFTLQAFAH